MINTKKLDVLSSIFFRDEDTKEYNEYLYFNDNIQMNLDSCLISLYPGEDSNTDLLSLINNTLKTNNTNTVYMIKEKNDKNCIVMNNNYLTVTDDYVIDDKAIVCFDKYSDIHEQDWIIRRSEDYNYYNILFNDDYALTYDSKSKKLIISDFYDFANQRWKIKDIGDKSYEK